MCPASVNNAAPPLLLQTRVSLSSHVVTILVPSGDHVTERSQFGCVNVFNKLPGVKIPPDETAVEAATSVEVCTVTATAPAVTAPMVKPLIVTEKLAAAGMMAEPVVMTKDVEPVAPHVPVRAATLLLPADIAVGVTPGAKNAVGYETVTVPRMGIAVTGVKLSVTGTAALPAKRSFDAIENDTALT